MGLLIRNSFLLAKTEDAYGVLGSTIANTDALKIISMEIKFQLPRMNESSGTLH